MNCPKCDGLLVREDVYTIEYPRVIKAAKCVNCGLTISEQKETKNDTR